MVCVDERKHDRYRSADTAGLWGNEKWRCTVVREGLVVFLQEHGLAVVLQREGEVTDSDKHDHGGREQGSALPNTMYSTQILRADSHPAIG
jgi:hypothetical protein